jgi:hypoxanthine-DNA glycosylase
MKHGLEPIIDENTKVLILGSLPSDTSIEKQQYYANKGNDFWKLMGSVIGTELHTLGYQEKIRTLKENGYGLWDVLRSSYRKGSMDHAISDPVLNDFTILKGIAPGLELVCFNGKAAGAYECTLRYFGYRTLVLPSSSGANRRDQQGRLASWISIRH